MKEIALNLTGLEIFFIITTLLSLVGNVIQFMMGYRDRKYILKPISSSLIAIFNDIKNKTLHAFIEQGALGNPKNPHTIDTLKWQSASFAQAMITYLQGLQEAVVGVLVTLNPKDKEGKEVFRASDYGLTEEEKKNRNE